MDTFDDSIGSRTDTMGRAAGTAGRIAGSARGGGRGSGGHKASAGEHVAAAGAEPTIAASPEDDHEFASLATANAKVWSHFKNMLTYITSHDAFKDIAAVPPPSVIDGNASQDPFELDKFIAAMAGGGSYKCGQNYFKHALMFTSTPSVPYRQASISALKSFFYPHNTPGPLCGTLAVAVASGVNPIESVDEAFDHRHGMIRLRGLHATLSIFHFVCCWFSLFIIIWFCFEPPDKRFCVRCFAAKAC